MGATQSQQTFASIILLRVTKNLSITQSHKSRALAGDKEGVYIML